MAKLLSIATAVPANCVRPADTKAYLDACFSKAIAARFARVVDAAGIAARFTVAPPEQTIRLTSPEARAEEYARHAVSLSEAAARRALAAAGLNPAEIDTVISISCTGYMMPSLDAHLIGRLGLRRDTRRIPITELGCSAGVAAVGLGASLLRQATRGAVLVVSAEISSLCLQLSEPSPADVMGSLLFADGAAALVLAAGDKTPRPEVLAARSAIVPDSLASLGMRMTSTGLRLLLADSLPALLRANLRQTVDGFLASCGVSRRDLRFHVVHPGGPKILESVAAGLQLPEAALRSAWDVWKRYGNMSSSTIFFVLRQLAAAAPPAEGDLGLMLAFGPGVSCEMALLRWHGALDAPPQLDEARPAA